MQRLPYALFLILLLLPLTAFAQSDADGDGVEDSVDLCPNENASFFDADGDGCLDALRSARHIEYWDPASLPLEYFVHEGAAPLITDDSDFAAIAAGFAAWDTPEVELTASFEGTVPSAATDGMDGIHTVSFEDPNFLGIYGTSVLAVGLTTSFEAPANFLGEPVRPGQIVDADMLFNPGRQFSTDTQGAGVDLRSVVTHEAGHLFGLSHGAIFSSTMFPALPAGDEGRSLTTDDLVAAFMAAPEAAALADANRLAGTLVNGDGATPIGGALILVLDAASETQIASSYTLPDGSWQFVGLPDGEYFVLAHPLDGSAGANNLVPGYVNALVESTATTLFLSDYWDENESTSENREAKDAIALNAGDDVANVDIVSNVDTTPPIAMEFRPGDAALNVRHDTVILVRFDEAIEFDTATNRFRLERASDSEGVAGSLSLLSSGDVLIFDPAGRLNDATEYRLILSAGIEDRFGNPTAAETVVSFTTAPPPPPALSSASPLYIVEGTTLVLSGEGFDSNDASKNSVFFEDTEATPSFASATHLVVRVPAGLSAGETVEVFVRRAGLPDSNPLPLQVTSAIEIARGTPEGAASLAGTPRRLALLPDSNFAYVAHSTGVASVVINALQADYRGVSEVAVGAGADDVAVHPDGRRVYAISNTAQRLVAINSDYVDLDARDPLFNTVLDELPMGAAPLALTIDPYGRRAFVVVDAGIVQIWDVQLGSATLHEQVGEIQTPSIDLAPVIGFDRSGSRLLVGSSDGRLFVYGAENLALVAEIPTSAEPRDVAADPGSPVAYLTHGDGTVTYISLNSNVVLGTASLGGSLFGVSLSPAGSLGYVANRSGDTLDVLDLNPQSATFRLLGSQFELGGDPVDVAVSPDGLRVYALEATTSELRVLGIGFGPVIRGITPTYAKPGDVVTIWGQGFAQLNPGMGTINFSNVYFGDTRVTPTHSSGTTLWATVPQGWNGEPVRVSFIGAAIIGFPDELLSNPVTLRKFDAPDPQPPAGTRAAFFTKALNLDGQVGVTGAIPDGASGVSRDGTIAVTLNASFVDIHDGVPTSPTFMHVIASFDTSAEPGGTPERVLVVPGSNLVLVGYFSSNVLTVVDGKRGSPSFGQKIADYDYSIVPNCVAFGPMVCTPDGKTLIVADTCNDRLLRGGLEAGQANYLKIDTIGPGVGFCRDIAMHPSGLAAYAEVAGNIEIIDLNPFSPNYFVSQNYAVQDDVTAVEVSPDGRMMYVMASEGAGSPHTLAPLDLTDILNPVNQPQIVIEGEGGGGWAKIAMSPQGRYGVISIGDGSGSLLYDFQTLQEIARFPFEGDTLQPYGMDWWPDGKLFVQSPWYQGSASVWGFLQGVDSTPVSGLDQTGVAGQPLAAPISLVMDDGLGVPSPNTIVEVSVTGGGGTLGNGRTHQVFLTDAAGRFRFDWTMGPTPDGGLGPTNAVRHSVRNEVIFGDISLASIADPNAVPISLASVLPSNSSTGVAATTSVQAIFSRPVAPATISPGSFALLGPGSTPVEGRFGFADANRRVSFLPAQPLAASTSYSIVLSGSIQDTDGTALSNPTTNVFETQAPPALRLSAISPPAAVAGTLVSLSGAGFDSDAAANLVSFNGVPIAATAGTSTSLRVLVPFDAPSGPVTVQALTQTSNALTFSVLIPTTSAVDEVLGIVDTGATVRSIAITVDGKFAYSVSTEEDQVLPVELETLTPGNPIAVGKSPVAIVMHPAGTRAYVANQLSDDVSVIDLSTNFVVATIPVGDAPVDLVAAPAGDRIYVVNSAEQTISVIDVEPANASYHTVLARIPTGSTTSGAAITPDGTKLYLGTSDGFLIVSLDPNEFGVLARIPTGSTTSGAAITPDGSLLILLTTGNEVLIVDITPDGGNAVLARIPTGSTTSGAAITPDGTLLYLIPEVGDEVLVVEISYLGGVSKADQSLGRFSFNILGTTFVGEDPEFLVFDPTGSGRAVTAGGSNGLLTILDDDPLCVPADLFLEPRTRKEPHRGRWILAHVEFPAGRDVHDVDLSTVFLQGVIPAVPELVYYDDIDNDGIDEVVFSFERLLFQEHVGQGEAVEVFVTGNFASDGKPFCSSDTIRTQRPELLVPDCGDVWSPGDKVTITWQSPAGVDTDVVDLLYSVDDGEHWFPMLLNEWDDGSAVWIVPDIGTTVLRIALIGYDKDKEDYGMYLLDCRGSVYEGVVPVAMSEVRLDVESGAGVLRWETLGETAAPGFYVLRAESAQGPYQRLNETPLLGAGKADGIAFEFRDTDIDANRSYWYRLDEAAGGFQHGPYELRWTLASALAPNSPNPFNPRTKIHFAIGKAGRARLAIYDLRGRQVRVLLDTQLRAREYDVMWDGMDTQGNSVASGIYIYRLNAPGFEQSKKMTLVR